MGQAASTTLSSSKSSVIFYDSDELGNRFTKATLSTLAVPMVIVAFPFINAYTFTSEELTGVKIMDGAIGGLLGVIGWPLAPFLACWGVFEVLFKDGPPEPLAIPQEIKDKAKREFGLNCENFYNIAVAGIAGTGKDVTIQLKNDQHMPFYSPAFHTLLKSSVVNGIMGMHDNDPQAAVTGETEATIKPRGYRHPDLRTMVLWDLPGAATLHHPAETYFEDKFLCAFDALIIVTAERLQETDIIIAKKAEEKKVPVFFVRNKADQAVEAKLRRYSGSSQDETYKWSAAVGELVKEVKQSIYKQLKSNNFSTRKLFIISAWNLQEFVSALSKRELNKDMRLIDEQRFMRTLIEGVLAKRRRKEKLKHKMEKEKQRQIMAEQRQRRRSAVGAA